MMSRRTLTSSLIVAWSFGLALSAARAGAADLPTLPEILETHRKIHRDLKQVLVGWTMTPELRVDLELAKRIDGYEFYHEVTTRAAFQGEKLYYDHHLRTLFGAKMPYKSVIERMAMTYDGETTRILERRPIYGRYGNEKLYDAARIWPGNEERQFFNYDNFLAYHGIPKTTGHWIMIGQKKAISDLVKLLEQPGFEVGPALAPAQDGTPCVVVSSADERIWLDPERNLAVRQHEWSIPGPRGLVSRVRLRDHVELVPGVWLARRFHRDLMPDPVSYPEVAGRPYIIENYEVTELTETVSDAMFTLKLPPATQVSDMTRIPPNPDGSRPLVFYTIPTTPADLDEIVQVATRERLHADERAWSGNSLSIGFVGVNAVAVACLLGFGWWKYQGGTRGPLTEGG